MASFFAGDYVDAVVADFGSYATKVGWAGNDYPESYFRSSTAILREKDESGAAKVKSIKYDYYHKPICDNLTDGDYEICNPVNAATGLLYDNREQADWYDLIPRYYQHAFDSALKATPSEHPLLMVEKSYNPPPVRQQLIEMAFEEINLPAVYLGKEAALCCYATGRTSATVVDVGYSGTTVAPVFEGFVEALGVRRSPIGAREMDELLLQHLDTIKGRPVVPLYQVRHKVQRSPAFHHASRLHLALEARENGAGVAVNTIASGGGAHFQVPSKPFELPDGTVVDIASAQRFGAADYVFGRSEVSSSRRDERLAAVQEDIQAMVASASVIEGGVDDEFSDAAAVGISKRKISRDTSKQKRAFSNARLRKACVKYLEQHVEQQLTASPIANMVCDAAYRCDRDQQATLLGNVVLAGGGACLGPTEQAVPDMLRDQVESIIHQHTPGWRVKLMSPSIQERSVLSYLGGSILASLGTFHEMWISRADYEEWGTAVVNRKCP